MQESARPVKIKSNYTCYSENLGAVGSDEQAQQAESRLIPKITDFEITVDFFIQFFCSENDIVPSTLKWNWKIPAKAKCNPKLINSSHNR